MAKEVLVVPHMHFDPTWRRCFDRQAVKHGTIIRSYAEVEELSINHWLALAGRGYPFSEGQVAILRKYLQRNPAKRTQLQKMAASGLLDVMMAGEVVIDTVLSSAEGLVRNFLAAWPFYRDLVGEDHPALKFAWLEDAFGNSPNMPQVLRGVGAEVACKLSYRTLGEDVWVGIDGTKIACYDRVPRVFVGGFEKNMPCPTCKGKGCRACKKTGMVLTQGYDPAALRKGFDSAAEYAGDWVLLDVLTEEIVPSAQVADLLDEMNRKYKGRCQFRFANQAELCRRFSPTMKKALARRDDKPSVDLNPAMPGCMVTRIKMKQRTRAVAYELLAAEAKLATASWQAGKPVALGAQFAQAWQHVSFCQFHDAITGTHVDNANAELMDMLDAAEKVARKHLPKAPASRGPVEKFAPARSAKGSRKLGKFNVTFDRAGIVSVLCNGRDVLGEVPKPLRHQPRAPRIGELVLEHDFGDAWGQRIEPLGGVQGDMTAVLLGSFHQAVETSGGAIRWRGTYGGHDPLVRRIQWTVTVRASADGRRLDFVTELDWDTASRRIRALFPVKSDGAMATYEVPFGFVDRTFDASKLDYSQWKSHNMEFPTLHWVRKSVDDRGGVALLNKGLPCNRYSPGRFDLSLVRSPQWEFCAAEPGMYEFWDVDGQRDAGKHRFEYSLLPYYEGLSETELTRMGYEYNLPASIDPPFAVKGDVVVTAWKPAQDGKSWILRLQDASGKGSGVTLDFGRPTSVVPTDLLERPQGPAAKGQQYKTKVHKHGIVTLSIS